VKLDRVVWFVWLDGQLRNLYFIKSCKVHGDMNLQAVFHGLSVWVCRMSPAFRIQCYAALWIYGIFIVFQRLHDGLRNTVYIVFFIASTNPRNYFYQLPRNWTTHPWLAIPVAHPRQMARRDTLYLVLAIVCPNSDILRGAMCRDN
jgi:hypothetical protein